MAWVALCFGVVLAISLAITFGLWVWSQRPNRDINADQGLVPLSVVAGAAGIFAATGLVAAGLIAWVAP